MPTKIDDSIIEKLKSYLFQPLLTILMGVLTIFINDIRTDLKQAMIQVNVDKSRIDNLERSVYGLQKPTTKTNIISPDTYKEYLALDRLFRHEEEYYVKGFSTTTKSI